jgi:CelD/BcsL family acetyltransferase involved in cellulose biosynthesis
LLANRPGPLALSQVLRRPPRLSSVRIEVIDTLEGVRGLASDYERLYQVTRNAIPFATQEWHLAWCEHFFNPDERIRDQPFFHVLRRENGQCVAIVPLVLNQRQFGPLRVGSLALVGADPGLTEIRTPLIEPGYEWLTVRAVHQQLARLRDCDWIQWSGMDAALTEALEDEVGRKDYRVTTDFLLDLPETWEALRAGLKRNIRESLRHCYNSLKRDQHTFEFQVASTPGEVRTALERFIELHTLRSQAKSGIAHRNFFSTPALQAFLYDVCGRFAARGAARVFQLRVRGEIVASRVAFAVGDCIYLYCSGFDPAWGRYSVMTTTFAEAVKYAIANGFKTMNLSISAEQSKLRWNPRQVEYRSALVSHELLRSRLLSRAYHFAQAHHQGPSARLLRRVLRTRKWN